ncbi:MAG: VCBS repeat-containing protein [bacterium]
MVRILKVFLLTLIFIVFELQNLNLFANEIEGFKHILSGELPKEMPNNYYGFVADIYGNEHEFIVFQAGNFIMTAQFENNNLNIVHQIPFQEINLWVCGDLNKDKKDEIIFIKSPSIQTYEWGEGKFLKKEYNLPQLSNYEIHQAIVGDIDNDDINEIILFAKNTQENSQGEEDEGFKLYLFILKRQKEKIKIIWSDKGKMGFYDPRVVPPPTLVCVGDIFNRSKNQLVIMETQSDVSPSGFNLLMWSKNRLKLDQTVMFANNKIWSSEEWESEHPEEKITSFVWYTFDIFKINNQIRILAPIYDGKSIPSDTYQGLIKISGNRFEVEEILKPVELKERGQILPNIVHCINIDGKGKGLLHITADDKYHFYR